jgi:hypothetical protein
MPRNVFETIEEYGDDRTFSPPPPEKPTRAHPGTPAKLRVLAKRLREGVELFHDADTAIDWSDEAAKLAEIMKTHRGSRGRK